MLCCCAVIIFAVPCTTKVCESCTILAIIPISPLAVETSPLPPSKIPSPSSSSAHDEPCTMNFVVIAFLLPGTHTAIT